MKADDSKEQRDRERIEAGWELERLVRKLRMNTRDIVDMVYDDGLTPKAALDRSQCLAREFPEPIDAGKAELIDDWLRSAWRGSSRAPASRPEGRQQELEISR